MRRTRFDVMLILLLLCGWGNAQPVLRNAGLGEFRTLVHASKPVQARRVLNQRIEKAISTSDRKSELYNRFVLGGLLQRWSRPVEAAREFRQALKLADSLKQQWLANRIRTKLVELAEARGMKSRADQFLSARTSVESAVMDASPILLAAQMETDAAQRAGLLREALQVVRVQQPVARTQEAEVLQAIGQTCMTVADYQCAIESSRQAGELFDKLGMRRRLQDSLLLQGTVQMEHGNSREAEVIFRRLSEAESASGRFDLRTPSMLAVALAKQGKREEARQLLQKTEEALRSRKSPQARFSASVIGAGYTEIGEYPKAVALFEKMLQRGPLPSLPAGYLAQSYFQLGRYRDAINAATKGLGERAADPEEEGKFRDSIALWWRAQAREKLGETENALQDAMSALELLEQGRQHLVQSDFMKRGFAGRGNEIVDFAVELAFRQKRYADAFAIAEQSRARAFLDLLASREGAPSERGAQVTDDTSRISRFLSRLGDPMVASEAYARPASLEQMTETAKRLQSTVLAYWVTAETSYIWMLDGSGVLRAAQHRVKEQALRALVERVRKRSDTVDRAAWRSLHAALMEPVRGWMPKRGALITVIPHGPLFDLPFAAFAGADGRYLIEDFRFHYVPSMSVLRLTRSDANGAERRVVVVADPVKLGSLPGGKPLPPLPASRKEARSIAASNAAGSVTLLQGADASLDHVRRNAASAAVLHFATHAVLQVDKPLESFLALSAGERLTAAEVYQMTLPSSLVVMSACRSASGSISADGVLGLTRAFFAAGASSVIASVWDVPDEPASLLMAEFYQQLRTSGPGEALRAAQVRIVQRLREGKFTVQTPSGPAILPEHPLLWAGFELAGEP